MAFPPEIFNHPFAKKAWAQVEVPIWISNNLKPGFGRIALENKLKE